MTLQEIIAEIPRLSIQERQTLLETITRSLQHEPGSPKYVVGSAERLLGMLKIDDSPSTDDERERMRDDYLRKKFS